VFDSPAPPDAGGAGPPDRSQPRGPASLTGADPRVAITGIVGALAIGAIAVVVAVAGAGGETIDGPATASGSAMPSGGHAPGMGELVVDVAGAVVTPGVYHLATGARVGDAIDAAGGFSPRVDVDRVGAELNLAAEVADGARIHVPSRDDTPATSAPGNPAEPAGGTGSGATAGALDLNRATKAELEALPGIGPVTADKILASRDTAPFTAVDDLRTRELVGDKTFEKIRPLLTVG
jgi:competence protein ComEA